jgi:hypothetical protein
MDSYYLSYSKKERDCLNYIRFTNAPYLMPNIPNIFRDLEKFHYATTIDLHMGYYSMPLSEDQSSFAQSLYHGASINIMCYHRASNPPQVLFKHKWVPFSLTPSSQMGNIIIFGYHSFDAHLLM